MNKKDKISHYTLPCNYLNAKISFIIASIFFSLISKKLLAKHTNFNIHTGIPYSGDKTLENRHSL